MTETPATGLLKRVAAGDAAAVRECLDHFGPLVWSLALRSAPSRADAEDAVQEIFVDVWRTAARYDPSKASEKGFVAMIARRRLIDRHRRRERRPVLVAMAEGSEPPSDEHERMDRRLESGEVVRALEKLKPRQRQFLELSLVQGLSHSEIARETDTPLGTVKSTIRRALAEIRSRLRDVDAEDREVSSMRSE